MVSLKLSDTESIPKYLIKKYPDGMLILKRYKCR